MNEQVSKMNEQVSNEWTNIKLTEHAVLANINYIYHQIHATNIAKTFMSCPSKAWMKSKCLLMKTEGKQKKTLQNGLKDPSAIDSGSG